MPLPQGSPAPASAPGCRSPIFAPAGFQTVILAGGLGTRILPITEKVPKPMIEVAGKPFLQHQLELLRAGGLRRVLLLVAYLGQVVEGYFGEGAALGMEIDYSYEPSPLGTAGALKNAQAKLDEEFLLLNGDTFLPINYAALLADFRRGQSPALIVACEHCHAVVKRNLAVTPDGQVLAYQKYDPAGMTHTDAGAIVLRREILDEVPVGRPCSLEEEIFTRLIHEGRLRAWTTSDTFIDMGSPAGLQALIERLG